VPCILDYMFFGVQTALPLCGAAHNAHRFAMVQHGVIVVADIRGVLSVFARAGTFANTPPCILPSNYITMITSRI
jgi:hypothetical protein